MAGEHTVDEALFFTVATVWREERVSCPHQDILRAYGTGALEPGAMDFVRFHLQERSLSWRIVSSRYAQVSGEFEIVSRRFWTP